MNDSQQPRKSKDRSPNFPFITLKMALERASQFYDEEKRGRAAFPVAAAHWGYSPSSSGAFQTVAALKNYGLMTDEGTGTSRYVRLTELAFRILLDTRPDSVEREKYKRQAALLPAVAAEVHQKWSDMLPSESTLNHYFVFERGFSPSSALKAVKIIVENEEFTSFLHFDSMSSNEGTENKLEARMHSSARLTPSSTAGSEAQVAAVGTKDAIERIISPDGKLFIEIKGEPSKESYSFLQSYFELRQKFFKPTSENVQGKTASSQPESDENQVA